MSSGAGKVSNLKCLSEIFICRWPEKSLHV